MSFSEPTRSRADVSVVDVTFASTVARVSLFEPLNIERLDQYGGDAVEVIVRGEIRLWDAAGTGTLHVNYTPQTREVDSNKGLRCIYDKGGPDEITLSHHGLVWITLHGLRHTSATLLLKAGVPPQVIQQRLGHKRIEMTLSIYAHVLPSMQQDAACRLGSLLHG